MLIAVTQRRVVVAGGSGRRRVLGSGALGTGFLSLAAGLGLVVGHGSIVVHAPDAGVTGGALATIR